jgi:prolyl 4-hydroxylase
MSHLDTTEKTLEIPFLYRRNLLTPDQCVEITQEFFENSLFHQRINTSAKKSTDLGCLFSERNKKIKTSKSVNYVWTALKEAFKEYRGMYRGLDETYTGWKVDDNFNFQFYQPGEGFADWHVENIPLRNRLLVWTIYLSSTKDGGTEFEHFNHVEKCESGKVIIFPADWTFSHRSQISYTRHKFIATGWASIAKQDMK